MNEKVKEKIKYFRGELLDQQRATKRVKKRLGKLLKDYEDDFYSRWSRYIYFSGFTLLQVN